MHARGYACMLLHTHTHTHTYTHMYNVLRNIMSYIHVKVTHMLKIQLLYSNDASIVGVCVCVCHGYSPSLLAGLSFQHQLALRIRATVYLLTMRIFFCDPITYFVPFISPHLTSPHGVCTLSNMSSTLIDTPLFHPHIYSSTNLLRACFLYVAYNTNVLITYGYSLHWVYCSA